MGVVAGAEVVVPGAKGDEDAIAKEGGRVVEVEVPGELG